jgi:Phage endonuclease I
MKTSSSKGKRKVSQKEILLKHGVRSGLEDVICKELSERGIPYKYEELTIIYTQPEKQRKYTPDIVLENDIVVEIKGRWVTADRQKIGLVKAQFPDLDLRMVFSNSKTKISKTSKTTYADYCDKLGIPYADKMIPDEWINEK